MKGVPLRIELGPRDIEAGKMVLVRRDTHEKVEAPLENAAQTVQKLLADIQVSLLERARKRKEERVVTASTSASSPPPPSKSCCAASRGATSSRRAGAAVASARTRSKN